MPGANGKRGERGQGVGASRPLRLPARILSLHGGGGNLAVNKMQMGRIRSALGSQITFDFFHVHVLEFVSVSVTRRCQI